MRILIAEDDKKIASFVPNGLKEAGFAVDHASNGEDGLHLALTEPYGAAVVDVMLPIQAGGVVEIAASLDGGDEVVLNVRDSGVGVPPEDPTR
jgi:DNA-binding response OmpR family regulator